MFVFAKTGSINLGTGRQKLVNQTKRYESMGDYDLREKTEMTFMVTEFVIKKFVIKKCVMARVLQIPLGHPGLPAGEQTDERRRTNRKQDLLGGAHLQ